MPEDHSTVSAAPYAGRAPKPQRFIIDQALQHAQTGELGDEDRRRLLKRALAKVDAAADTYAQLSGKKVCVITCDAIGFVGCAWLFDTLKSKPVLRQIHDEMGSSKLQSPAILSDCGE